MKLNNFLLLIISLILLILVACSSQPSDSAIQTAIAQTQFPKAQSTLEATGEPTATPKPRVSCPDEDVSIYLDDLDNLLEEFDDTVTIAGSTARMSLAPIIQDMQSQKREARRLDRPECANYVQDLVVVY